MHCVGGQRLVSVLFVAVLITIFFVSKLLSLPAYKVCLCVEVQLSVWITFLPACHCTGQQSLCGQSLLRLSDA